jgi:hypothetical protein
MKTTRLDPYPITHQQGLAGIFILEKDLPDGVPCKHPGCLNHVSHPCECCGRVAGKSNKPSGYVVMLSDPHQFVSKEMAFEEFCKSTGQKKWSQAKFKKALKAFCQYYNYVFNPKEFHNSGGRIIKTIDGKSQEVFYINTEPADKMEKIITDFEAITDDEKTIFDE